jgi:hypothetical protein
MPRFRLGCGYHGGMIPLHKWLDVARIPRAAVIVAGLGTALLASSALPADARGGHGFGRSFGGHGVHGAPFAGDRRHANDTYIKAASEERDRLLNTQIKSICRGC